MKQSEMKINASLAALPFLISGIGLIFASQSAFSQRPVRKTIDFNRDVRPILAEKCLKCHGNDPNTLMADLTLDKKSSALAKRPDGGFAVVPFSPASSLMIKRIDSHDPNVVMPPPDTKKTLTAKEKQTLRQWILEGAEYKEHWAYVPPVRPTVPKVVQNKWVKNPIDAFVLAKLEPLQLKPAPAASKNAILRRVWLDLTGLPPTQSERQAFLADTSPNAYETMVDRALASPHFGERMAMDWLDYSRYADSNGYQADFERFQYRWRDWLIEAWNKNEPFDKFTVDQLAGDLLPNPTPDQVIATGFNRNHRLNTEGGVIAEEWRVENVMDRTETTATVWLGITAGCARCHDHKYDPLSQKEFYSLYAFFNSVPESGTGEERPINHPPTMKAPYSFQTKRIQEISQLVADLQQKLDSKIAANEGVASTWNRNVEQPPSTLSQNLIARYALSTSPKVTMGSAPVPKVVGPITEVQARSSGAVQLTREAYFDLGEVGAWERTQPFSVALWLNPDKESGVPLARMEQGPRYRGWNLYIFEGNIRIQMISDWPMNAFQTTSETKIPVGKWSHVSVTYGGTSNPAGVKMYINGELVKQNNELNALTETMIAPVTTKIGRRTNSDEFEGKVDDVALFEKVLHPDEIKWLAGADPARLILGIPKESRTPDQRRELARLWSMENDGEFREIAKQLDSLKTEREQIEASIPTVMVMQELPAPRKTHLLLRGQYDKPDEEVSPSLPKIFGSLPKGTPSNRLGLAKWIVDKKNPLTARVAVNRLWERFFGMGIVSTSEDFGTRAEFPSHPEMLDWLATEYVRLNWDTKALIKLVLTSATYRQSSAAPQTMYLRDPANRLLARGPRMRLNAEVIRDQALAVSGLLTRTVGGPSVRPYQPAGIWDELAAFGNLRNYKHESGPGLYRRSMYTIWKRTAAPSSMMIFDAPSREICRVSRSRTNTPLQALALLNEVTYIEAARAFAQKILQRGGSSEKSRIEFAFLEALARKPDSNELEILSARLAKNRAKFESDSASVEKLLTQGEFKHDPNLRRAEVAAYTVLASTILNLDEMVTKE